MADKYRKEVEELAKEQSLYPQESLLKVREGDKSLFIGIPRERSLQENRVAISCSKWSHPCRRRLAT